MILRQVTRSDRVSKNRPSRERRRVRALGKRRARNKVARRSRRVNHILARGR